MTFCSCPADFDQEKIIDGWKNIQVVQALKPVPGNGQVHASLLDCICTGTCADSLRAYAYAAAYWCPCNVTPILLLIVLAGCLRSTLCA